MKYKYHNIVAIYYLKRDNLQQDSDKSKDTYELYQKRVK